MWVDETDELDGIAADDASSASEPREILLPDGTPDWEVGFAGGAGAVRVWATPEGEISKVRMAPTWRERVAQRGKPADVQQAGLERAFGEAFAQINMVRQLQAQEGEPSSDPLVSAPAPGPEPLTWDSLNRVNGQILDLQDRLDRLAPDEGWGRWVGHDTEGIGADGKVRLQLSSRGLYSRVTFDPEWLRRSHVGSVCRGVQEAAQAARGRFVPATYEPGERDALNNQIVDLNRELSAMMKRGFE